MVKPPPFNFKHYKPDSPEGESLKREMEEYYKLVGHLSTIFALLEVHVFNSIGLLSRAPEPMLKALIPDIRINAGISVANRVLAARKIMYGETEFEKEITSFAARTFEQLGHINGLRNDLIHYGAFRLDERERYLTISNWYRALTEDKLKERRLLHEDLKNVIADAGEIAQRLSWLNLRLIDPSRSTARYEMQKRAEKPWLYTPPSQPKSRGRTRGNTQAQKRPPRSSRR